MSARGHKAVVPPPDFQAAERITDEAGLLVAVINKEGFERVFDFATMPVPEPMQRSLAKVFAEQSVNWSSHASGQSYWQSLRAFARFLKNQDHPAPDLDGLTAATLRLWRNNHKNTPGGREALAKIRTLLQRDPRLSHGPVAEELARRAPRAVTSSRQSYATSDRELVVKAAERQFRSALLMSLPTLVGSRAPERSDPFREFEAIYTQLGRWMGDMFSRTTDVTVLCQLSHENDRLHGQQQECRAHQSHRNSVGCRGFRIQ